MLMLGFRENKTRLKIHTHKFEKTVKKTIIVILIMIGWSIVAGIVYVYITGRDADKKPSVQAPVEKEKPPIPDPVKPAVGAPIGASVQSLLSPVKAGEETTIIIKTGSDATCVIVASYNKTPSKDPELAPKKASDRGSVEWTWTVDTATAPGKYPIKVTCDRDKKVGYVEGYLEVTK